MEETLRLSSFAASVVKATNRAESLFINQIWWLKAPTLIRRRRVLHKGQWRSQRKEEIQIGTAVSISEPELARSTDPLPLHLWSPYARGKISQRNLQLRMSLGSFWTQIEAVGTGHVVIFGHWCHKHSHSFVYVQLRDGKCPSCSWWSWHWQFPSGFSRTWVWTKLKLIPTCNQYTVEQEGFYLLCQALYAAGAQKNIQGSLSYNMKMELRKLGY